NYRMTNFRVSKLGPSVTLIMYTPMLSLETSIILPESDVAYTFLPKTSYISICFDRFFIEEIYNLPLLTGFG
ncbi:MAG TPA: hypothetical protein VJ945_01630, partial [Flavobacteriaceae bacterium]|nr:hypothetical protein [Flavobacteriaceae bacterium]